MENNNELVPLDEEFGKDVKLPGTGNISDLLNEFVYKPKGKHRKQKEYYENKLEKRRKAAKAARQARKNNW